MKRTDRKYTKGDCYAICEMLESLLYDTNYYIIADICDVLGYETQPMRDLLQHLHNDIDGIIAQEQSERDDTDQMADIMQLVHISGHDD